MQTDVSLENQSITNYNPIITRGRKCRLPDELILALPRYICYKPNIDFTDIDAYIQDTYHKLPFVICRNLRKETYEIWSDYTLDHDYVLVLFAETTRNDCFIVMRENGLPLTFSENPSVKSFFASMTKKTTPQLRFFEYIESMFNHKIKINYDAKINEILEDLYEKYEISFVGTNNIIQGICKDSVLYFTPTMFYKFFCKKACF